MVDGSLREGSPLGRWVTGVERVTVLFAVDLSFVRLKFNTWTLQTADVMSVKQADAKARVSKCAHVIVALSVAFTSTATGP